MSVTYSDRGPANATVNTDGTETLTITWGSVGAHLFEERIYSRKNGGSWSMSRKYVSGTFENTQTAAVTLTYGDEIEWYGLAYDANMESATTPIWTISRAPLPPDTTDPTITEVTPATGNVEPGASGVTFQATVADDRVVSYLKLYVDSELEETWTTAGTKSYTMVLAKGAHTYEFTAADTAGNTATTGVVNITVVNVAPVAAEGAAITVAGETGAVSVANLGNVWVTWTPFEDYNSEDSLTYTVDYQIASGGWNNIATATAATTVEWTPNDGLGAGEIRVKANDGTGDSSYLSRSNITVTSSQSPNEPTITSPAGAEDWREGETHAITWTVADPEHPESLPCVYEIQFSADGTFTDAVTLTTTADGGSYSWTLPTDLV